LLLASAVIAVIAARKLRDAVARPVAAPPSVAETAQNA
jgi:hypothetical protein